jgi:hypothetical protein
MGGAHHDVGSLSRKRYTQCVGQQPKGHRGNSENTGGEGHPQGRRTKARKGVRMHERSGRKTDTTGGAKKHQHARYEATREQTGSARTGDSKGGHRRRAFSGSGIWLRAAGVIPCRQGADWVLGVRLRRTQLAALAPSWRTENPNIIYIALHCIIAITKYQAPAPTHTQARSSKCGAADGACVVQDQAPAPTHTSSKCGAADGGPARFCLPPEYVTPHLTPTMHGIMRSSLKLGLP